MFALVLTACVGSTGIVRADLDPPGLSSLRARVVKYCTGIPKPWPDAAEMVQSEVESYAQRDATDTANCATTSLRYVNRIATRDKGLTSSLKK